MGQYPAIAPRKDLNDLVFDRSYKYKIIASHTPDGWSEFSEELIVE